MHNLQLKGSKVQSKYKIYFYFYSIKNNKPFRLSKKGRIADVYKEVNAKNEDGNMNNIDA